MSSRTKKDASVPAEVIRDVQRNASYKRGKFLGKGGFARVYEFTCTRTGIVYAGKIVPKVLLQKPHQRQKMYQEITIHRSLKHKYVVQFHSHFEDENNVYIVLELCPKRTLMELQRRRKTVTEPEARYFMHQMCESLKYLHENNVVHRDLKLGNLLLNENLEVKISDFGLAAKIDHPGDRKMTMCGTPNYIAPEVLLKTGHSYEVDIWALGCILYTLLVGKPPFETETLNETYARIKKNKYVIPASLEQNCPSAADLIKHMLREDPNQRPTIAQIYASPFLNEFRPTILPSSCLTMAPRCDTVSLMNQTALYGPPMAQAQAQSAAVAAPHPPSHGVSEKNRFRVPGDAGSAKPTVLPTAQAKEKENVKMDVAVAGGQESAVSGMAREPQTRAAPAHIELLQQLQGQLQKVLNASPRVPFRAAEGSPYMDEAEDPALGPMLWVSKWVDYSDKYGLGYQLSDDSYGVLFNDKTRLILLPNGFDLHYVTYDWVESYHNIDDYPPALSKKVRLIKYFRDYMNERLVKAGAMHAKTDGDALARYPFMLQWHRSSACVMMVLRNGTVQVNYFDDHVKVVLCPVMQAVTYLPSSNQEDLKTYSFSGLAQHGATKDMYKRLKDAYVLIGKLIQGAMAPSSASVPSGSGGVPVTAK